MNNKYTNHEEEMNDKIQKLLDYIEKEFPDGCGHPNNEYDCHGGCPLYKSKAYTRQFDLCSIIGIGHYLQKRRGKKIPPNKKRARKQVEKAKNHTGE